MNRFLHSTLLTFALCLAAAKAYAADDIRLYAKPIIADISQRKIDIHAQFNGTEILLYGARNEPGDIIAVVTGPYVDVMLSRKDNIAGMWMQVERKRYNNLPIYYAVASTKPLDKILPEKTLDVLGISYPKPELVHQDKGAYTMRRALLNKLKARGWLSTKPTKIHYFGETLFRTQLAFPSNMPRGTYTVDVFLVYNGRVVAAQSTPLKAVKTGIDFWLYDTSRHRPWLYGLSAALLSLLGGWLGSRIVGRRR